MLAPSCWNLNFGINDGYRVGSLLLKVLRISANRSLVIVTVALYSLLKMVQ